MLGFDLETTGTDPCSDLPVQVALVRFEPGGVSHREVFIVDPGREVPAGAQAIHGISTERARREGRPLGEAAKAVHTSLREAQGELVPVVVMNASFDITIAAGLFELFGLDPFSWTAVVDPIVIDRKVDRYRKGKRRLDALCATYGVALDNAHDAGSDADATLELARAIAARHPEVAGADIGDLTRSQADWHRAWATEYDDWRRKGGKPGLEPAEFCWPLRRLTRGSRGDESEAPSAAEGAGAAVAPARG